MRLETFYNLSLVPNMKRVLTTLLLFSAFLSSAQNFLGWKYNDRYFSASTGTGISSYFGELNESNSLHNRLSTINIGLEARLLSRLAARVEAHYMSIEGSDANAPDSSFQRQRNLSFRSRNIQLQLSGIYYLKKYSGDFYKRANVDPYITAGIGYMYYNPTADLGGQTYSLRELETEEFTYNKWVVTVPMGAGIKFKVNDFFNFNVEASYILAFSDYLDDVSTTYGSSFSSLTAELLSDRKDEIGVVNEEYYDQIQPGAKRGEAANNDSLLLLSFKAEFYLPHTLFSKK